MYRSEEATTAGTKVQIALVGVILFLLAAAVGAYAYDANKDDQIADGVSIGGVDVGGLSADEAESRVRADIVEPLQHPVHVEFDGERYTLPAEKLGVRADVEGMVDEAVDESREGGIFGRLWRYTTNGDVNSDVQPKIEYSRDTVQSFIEGVAGKINQEPQDASIDPTPTELTPVREQPGITVRQEDLRERLVEALHSPRARVVQARVEKVQPEVTMDEVAGAYPSYITIDRGSFTLRLFKDLKLADEYTIAVGQVGYDTSAGLYDIQSKQVNPTWYVPNEAWAGDLAGTTVPPGPSNPLQARWMGFNGGAGIHGTSDVGSLGTAASHGCIRMSVPDVTALYDQVDVGTPVYIF
jgi:lipoprotein-anchoring transpeptidase ErfK/SrfK